LLDGLFAHPAGDSDTDTAHELIITCCATIEFFRSLLDDPSVDPTADPSQGMLGRTRRSTDAGLIGRSN